jgi:hypothetical protein
MMGMAGLGAFCGFLWVLAGCGGSSTSAADLAEFTGADWSGTLTTSFNCAGKTLTANDALTGGFTAQGADGVTHTSSNGCVYDFTVSGDTATLSNAPVVCSTTSSTGAAVALSVTSYTITTSDGMHLTGSTSGTATSGAVSCTFTGTLTATR